MKKYIALSALMLISFSSSFAQLGENYVNGEYLKSPRAITTAVPIIAVAPDSRSGGMGNTGVASGVDANSIFWNPAKLAFLDEGASQLSLSYTPWLQDLVNDINLAYVSYVFSLGERQGAGISLRYFTLGDIIFKDENNQDLGTYSPYEFTLDGAYALKLSETMSLAVGLRYIFSDLTQGQVVAGAETKPGQSFAADIGYYFKSKDQNISNGQKQSFSAGANISNIGGKISYGNDADADFIPTNLRLGGGYHLQFDKYNRISFYVDVNKLLVPTPPIREGDPNFTGDPNENGIDNDGSVLAGKDDNVGAFEGMFQSFNDAPNGFPEEMEEFIVNVGAEFWYDNKFAFRGGYQYEDEQKGGRQFFTMGIGIKYNVFGLDMSYLIPASSVVRSPLENTLRFTLLFDFQAVND